MYVLWRHLSMLPFGLGKPSILTEKWLTLHLRASTAEVLTCICLEPDSKNLFVCIVRNVVWPCLLILFSFGVVIGSKVSDPCCYGHTQFHLIPDKLKRERFIIANLEDQIEVVYRANGVASLFAWTAAQAMYQGKTVNLCKFSCPHERLL